MTLVTERLEKRLPEIIKGALQRVPIVFQGYIGVQFGDTGRKSANFIPPPNTGSRLRVDTGRLLKSFLPNSRENVTEYSSAGQAFSVVVGTRVPYAAIHENGGVITQPRSAKQRRLFWAFYYRTGEDKWKYAALSRKPLVIRIPKRPYFAPAAQRLQKEGAQALEAIIRRAILEEIR